MGAQAPLASRLSCGVVPVLASNARRTHGPLRGGRRCRAARAAADFQSALPTNICKISLEGCGPDRARVHTAAPRCHRACFHRCAPIAGRVCGVRRTPAPSRVQSLLGGYVCHWCACIPMGRGVGCSGARPVRCRPASHVSHTFPPLGGPSLLSRPARSPSKSTRC